ncbi:tRNA pseudouridine(38-40) synthase TruA [Methanobacterium spitsbergense]|uniref:tRNA pseudouridine synthase A n=1 Tax=Methanobacterium spitsbergense TaxID=2874285 RepID=A0A8T5V1R6_9EURY|nr:tRNA pseudouridine(38-40) synthase TruA [Methanobacterium spitsbergense]MBZ2165801.1 tRNA pseudouridine(38-40) synthase TruA [Methanobacterium spitsbergense]
MVKTAFKIAYIGTDFYGFQRQPDLPTVEGELLRGFKKAGVMDDPNKSNYSIAGRTDRGVHSLGNVISLHADSNATINQINYYLPASIQIIGKVEVPHGFKPRFAEYRHYKYIFFMDPYNEKILNLELMKNAAKMLEGTHNFHNFSKRSERSPIRNVKELNVNQIGQLIVIDVIGESFLWNMVRKMVQVITMVGNGKMEDTEINLLLNPDNHAPITPVPPEGLILMDIKYKDIDFTYDKYARNNFFKTLKEEYIRRRTIAAAEEEMMKVLKAP